MSQMTVHENPVRMKQRRGSLKGLLPVIVFSVCLSLTAVYRTHCEEVTLPRRYSVEEAGKRPQVRDQGSLGTCWAISAVGALESALLPQHTELFSADHLSLNNGFVISQKEGGDYKMIMAYLASWRGPVRESEDPYGDGVTVDGLLPGAHVQEMVLLRGKSREEIKAQIYSGGAVLSSLVMNRALIEEGQQLYNEETYGYCNPEKGSYDHEVLLLGWDDDYSRENFAGAVPGDGAWICQNTWGEAFGDKGVFYVSYYDANIARRGLAFTRVENADNYDRIYQADECGWQAQQGYGRSYAYFANVFTAQVDEELKAVGFYATKEHTEYELYIVHDLEDTSSFENRRYLQRGELSERGYFTIDLKEAVPLKAGERFAVIVSIDSEGAKRPVAVEIARDRYTQNVTTQGKESYISLYGLDWENTQETSQSNVCLKAYTDKE